MIDYVFIVGKYYPGVEVSCSGNESIYSNLVWVSSSIPQADLDIKYIAECKINKKSEINAYRDSRIYGGYTDINGVKWSTSPVDIQNLNGICTLISVGAVTSAQIWRDANNVNHTLQPADFVVLAGSLATFVSLCYQNSWTHKANVDALTTETDITAYNYTTNWP